MKLMPLVILLAFLFSCQEKAPPKIEIDDDTLVYILSDIHMAEAAVSSVPISVRDSIEEVLQIQIAKKYQLDAVELENYMREFQMDVPRHRELYNRVIDTLDSWGNNANRFTIINREVVKDSLK